MEIQSKKLLTGGKKGLLICGGSPPISSKNGLNWNYISNLPMEMYVEYAAFGNGVYVLANHTNTNKYCMYSKNGKTWSTALISTEESPQWNALPFLSFAGNKFYYSFKNNSQKISVYYSTNGVNWTKLNIPDVSIEMPNAWRVGYFNGKYLAAMTDQQTGVSDRAIRFFTSNDGLNWTVGTRLAIAVGAQGYGMNFVVGDDRIMLMTPKYVFYSTDGVNVQYYAHGFPNERYCLGFGKGKFICSHDWHPAFVRYTTDGFNWTDVSSNVPSSVYGFDEVGFGNGVYILNGSHGMACSTNGVNWSLPTSIPSDYEGAAGFCYGGK